MSSPVALQPGDLVPDIAAASSAGGFGMAARRGRILVLYFYPKDNTPGCTVESQEFAAAQAQFAAAGADIVGVSRDSLASHAKFRARFELPFDLVADEDEALCVLFGVMKQKKMYGKTVRGIERSTFLVDRAGVLRQQWRAVKIPGHVEAVLQAVKALA